MLISGNNELRKALTKTVVSKTAFIMLSSFVTHGGIVKNFCHKDAKSMERNFFSYFLSVFSVVIFFLFL